MDDLLSEELITYKYINYTNNGFTHGDDPIPSWVSTVYEKNIGAPKMRNNYGALKLFIKNISSSISHKKKVLRLSGNLRKFEVS